MIKVGFIEGLKSGDPIIVPGRAREPVRFAGQAMMKRSGEGADAASRSRRLLRRLIALRKQGRKD